MAERPELTTERLLLRPFTLADALVVRRLAGARDIASTTLNIPHPYEDGMAEEWISTHQQKFERGELINFAIVLRNHGRLIGAIGLVINQQHESAELGYWIGKPYWGNGYCTEAAKAVLHYGFTVLGLNRIHASHFSRNLASGRVMEKIGMKYEGCSRQHVKKWGVFEDLKWYAILKSEYESRSSK
ncbi:MAG: GNAT family N-acetyltransferase [Anaerolineae bacterium]|nr:GNAT family N-acetyltransferase [Anaerolineae bacterium]